MLRSFALPFWLSSSRFGLVAVLGEELQHERIDHVGSFEGEAVTRVWHQHNTRIGYAYAKYVSILNWHDRIRVSLQNQCRRRYELQAFPGVVAHQCRPLGL